MKNGHEDDFRWLIDMQSQSWYPNTQTRSGAYAAKLFVRHGTFFTQHLTKYALYQVEMLQGIPFPKAPLGRPAQEIGAEITLGGTESLVLTVNGSPIPWAIDPLKRYEVRFSNMCTNPTRRGPCDFFWWHPQEEKRNDFYHHRAPLMPSPSAKYGVVLASGQLALGTRDPIRGRHKIMNTNDAPCMGAGYGGGDGPY
ncbi:MAG TPA: hypothetical protein VMS31_00020 [Pyrinomonadaceae bacterium]|nr:hypothetical protein [Pyrinomonadaceae bacterium]